MSVSVSANISCCVVADKQASFRSLATLLQEKYYLHVQKQRSTLYRARYSAAEDQAPSWSEPFSYIAPVLRNFQHLKPGTQASVDVDEKFRFTCAFVGIGTAVFAC